MKLLENRVNKYDFLITYEYEFDELNSADHMKKLFSILTENGYSIGEIKFLYTNDDCICKPDVIFADLEEFNECCYEIDKDYLRTIHVKMQKGNQECTGSIDLFNNAFNMYFNARGDYEELLKVSSAQCL